MVGIEIEVPLVRVWHPLWTIVEFTNSSYQSKKLKINWLSNYIYYNLMKLSNYISLVCLTCLEYRLTLFGSMGKKGEGFSRSLFKIPSLMRSKIYKSQKKRMKWGKLVKLTEEQL